MSKKTVCVAGKNDIAVNILEYLYDMKDDNFELVVSCNRNEDGQNGWQKSLRFFAERLGIREVTLDELYEIEDLVFLSLEYDRIIRPHLFKTKQLYNIHFSALPKYKGMYTSALPLLNDEAEGGVTFHRIASGIDTGEIIKQQLFEINEDCTSRDLYLKCIAHGTEVVKAELENVLSNACVSTPQPAAHSTYYSKAAIDYSNLVIDTNTTAYGIGRQLRAFTFREYQLPKIYEREIFDYEITSKLSTEKPGTILEETESFITIATVDYDMVLYLDQFEKIMEACLKGYLEYLKSISNVEKYLEQKNNKGWTPLIVATYNNQKAVVNYLLSKGADVQVKNHNGTNLLMYAKNTYLNTGDSTLFELMLEKGIRPEEADYMGYDLFYYIQDIDVEKKNMLYNLMKNNDFS